MFQLRLMRLKSMMFRKSSWWQTSIQYRWSWICDPRRRFPSVRTGDGVWHVGYALVDAAGGGCTAPAAAHGNNNWMRTLGETRALASRTDVGSARMTLRMRHPMDTGLAAGIPVFYMNELQVRNATGELVADLNLYEPVSENPTLTLRPRVGAKAETLTVSTRDTEGNVFDFPLSIPAASDS